MPEIQIYIHQRRLRSEEHVFEIHGQVDDDLRIVSGKKKKKKILFACIDD